MNIRAKDKSSGRMKVVKIDAVKYMRLTINKIIHGSKIIWSIITSCFGSGTWISSSFWSSTEFWKNN